MKKASKTQAPNQEKFNANQNKLYMANKAKGFDQGVGTRSKSTKND